MAQGFTQPVHLGSMVEQVPQAIRSYGPANLGPGDVIITNDPFPSGVHLNDVSLDLARLRRGRAARLRREPRPSRRRRRRRAGVDRCVPRGVPGGRDHPAGEGGRGRAYRRGRLQADPGADPLEARDGRRLPRPDRRERDGSAPAGGARRPPRPRDDRGGDGGAARLHRAAHARGDRGVAARRLRVGRLGRHGRLHRRARTPPGADRDHGRGRVVRPRRQRPAAACAGQLHLRADLLRLRLRAEVPDRPRSAGQRRLLPARAPRRAGGKRDELHLALAGRRRLGDADPSRRRHLPGASCRRCRRRSPPARRR